MTEDNKKEIFKKSLDKLIRYYIIEYEITNTSVIISMAELAKKLEEEL